MSDRYDFQRDPQYECSCGSKYYTLLGANYCHLNDHEFANNDPDST